MSPTPADKRDVELKPEGAVGAKRAGSVASLPRDDFDRDVWCVLGLAIDAANIGAALEAIEAAARDRRRLSFVTANVNWLVRALKNDNARREILNADFSLADGAPLALAGRLLGAPLKSRTAGADILEALRARPAISGRRLRVFFFGGREGAAVAAAAALDGNRGGLESAGALNPGYGDVAAMSGADVIDAINAAAPDFVVVALGAAKGQAWIDRNKERLAAPVIAHLGAAIDFVAGVKARSPLWLQRLGLEWAWRIREEPALLRRYLTDGVAFLGFVLTRFLPQLFLGRIGVARHAADAVVRASERGVLIALAGDLGAPDLAPVRAAFREAAAADGDVVLDFSDARGVDRAFLGLILMLEKHLTRRGRVIKVKALSASQRVLFKSNAMNYSRADENGRGRGVGANVPPARAAAI